MKYKIRFTLLVVLLILSVLLGACAPSSTPAETASPQPATSEGSTLVSTPTQSVTSTESTTSSEVTCPLKIGYVSDVGKINDQSFNQASWTGVQEGAKAIGLSEQCYSFIETTDSADYEKNINAFVKEGYNVCLSQEWLVK